MALKSAFELEGKSAEYTLIHNVETVVAMVNGEGVDDQETLINEKLLNEYKEMLTSKGFKVNKKLGFGDPAKTILTITNKENFDI